MFQFDHPWVFTLLVLPFFVRQFTSAYKEQKEAVRTPFFNKLVDISKQKPSEGAVLLKPSVAQWMLLTISWILLIGALARPVWVGEPIVKTESARDLMIAVDLSGSMKAEDFTDRQGNQINRLEAVKLVLNDFITKREHDRIGLILFGQAPFLQVPFTQDHDMARTLLNESQLGMAGYQTMLGDAIGLSIKLFEEGNKKYRTLILLTDGNDTGSKVLPVQAAIIAEKKDITIHTIAIGDPESQGEAKMDIESLMEVSRITEGQFYQANNREELEGIYAELDKTEKQEFESTSYRPKTLLFHWPVGIALGLFMMYQLLIVTVRARRAVPVHI